MIIATIQQDRTNKRRRKKGRLLLFILISLLFVGTVSYSSYLYMKVKAVTDHSYEDLQRGSVSEQREKAVEPLSGNLSLLIMGVDESNERYKEYGDAIRTDALLLATINKHDKSVKLLSIPRDCYVYISSRQKKDKIAHAHVFGGVDSTIQTVEQFLNVPVDYYVKFNFKSFTKIVDALGGIDLQVPVNVTEQNSLDQANAITLQKGQHHLNGEQALALARTRHIDSDYMRGRRQQIVFEAIAKKAQSVETLGKLGTILEAIGSDVKTNLTLDDMIKIANNMVTSPLHIEKLQVKGEDQYIQGIYYYVPNEAELRNTTNTLRTHLNIGGNSSQDSTP